MLVLWLARIVAAAPAVHQFFALRPVAIRDGLRARLDCNVPPTVKLTAQKFGSERANLVFGWIYAGHQLGAASAAFSAGLSRTELASYLPAFFAAGLLCIVAALMTLAIARQSKQVAV